jgi:hypothetical protein
MIYDRSKTDNTNFLINELPMRKAEQENYRFCTGDKGKMQQVHPIDFLACTNITYQSIKKIISNLLIN